MSNKKKKNYKKVYLNGECIIDFTQQTINENNVASGNMFFNSEGKLVEGQDDSLTIMGGYIGGYEYWSNKDASLKAGVHLFQVDSFNSCLASSLSSGFPFTSYLVLSDNLTYVSSMYEYDYLEVGSFYLPKQKNASADLYKNLATYVTGGNSCGDILIFCEEDISEYIPSDQKKFFIFNCSKIKTTENNLFDYVIADNKAYILGIHYTELANYVTNHDTGYNFTFPDMIENKPVVGIGGYVFSYNYNNYNSYNSYPGAFHGSFGEIQLPENLEILGSGCFCSMSCAERIKVNLPDSLKMLLGTKSSYTSSNSFAYSSFDLSGQMENDVLSLPDLEYAAFGTLYDLLDNSGIYLPEDTYYIPTKTNPYAFYTNDVNSSNIVINEGCIQILQLPYSFTTISFPSTLKMVPALGNKSSLTAINFAETIAATKIPTGFCSNISNSDFTTLVIPEGIEEIGSQAFWYCNLNDITLPTTLKRIDIFGFYDGKSSGKISKIFKVKATTPPNLYGTNSLTYANSNITKIIVPQGCLDAYKKASVWSNWADKMEESTEW